jgi:hypothetical protein
MAGEGHPRLETNDETSPGNQQAPQISQQDI